LTRLIPYLFLLVIILPGIGYSQEQNQPPTINIGLLVPDSSDTLLTGFVNLAVKKANQSGGYRGQQFNLVVRSTEGPWGMGSKESVALIYEDQVCAIVGSLDGRNAHLAEQVAAKSHLSYIEARATDPTLSQAFVPWFMRVVPNDDQQAEALMELIVRNGEGKIGVLSNDTYEARYAVKSLVKTIGRETGRPPLVMYMDASGQAEPEIIEHIRTSAIKHLIIPYDAPLNKEFVISLNKELPMLRIYGTLHFTMGVESREIPWKFYEGMYLLTVGPAWDGNEYPIASAREGLAADAVALVIEAIKQVGTDREAIRDQLLNFQYDKGFTGPFAFDEMGNRTRKPDVARIENGKRVAFSNQ